MYKYILEGIGDINWMALFALLSFFFVFSMAIYLAFKKDKSQLDYMASMPLEDDNLED